MSGRDAQRSKVYAAEDATGLYHGGRSEDFTLAEAQALVDFVLADRWVQKHFRMAKSLSKTGVKVIPGRTRGFAGRRGWTPVIALSPWARQEYIALHEIAHHLAGLGHGHDRFFCGTLVLLVARFMGHEQAETLRRSLGRHQCQASYTSMPSWPGTVQLRYRSTPEPAPVAAAARKQTVEGCCSRCGTERNVGKGGSYGSPLCQPCYNQWRKEVRG